MRFRFVFFLFSLLTGFYLPAQDTTQAVSKVKVYSVETKDGNHITGTVVSEDAQKVVLLTRKGEITIPVTNIRIIREIEPGTNVRHPEWPANPAYMHYVAGPTAFNLKRNQFYYESIELFGQSLTYGFTDHFSLGVGTEIASLLDREPPHLFYLQAKAAYPCGKNWNAGGGFVYVYNHFSFHPVTYACSYGLVTWGNKDNNLSLGAGYVWKSEMVNNWYKSTYEAHSGFMPYPMVSLAGTVRFSRHFAFISENWIVPHLSRYFTYGPPYPSTPVYTERKSYDYETSAGIRFMTGKISLDAGYYVQLNHGDFHSWGWEGLLFFDFACTFPESKAK